MIKILTIIFCALLVQVLAAAPEMIVNNGRLEAGFAIGQKPESKAEALLQAGVGNMIASNNLYSPQNFTVKAKLRIASLDSTAAAFGFGENFLGFDCSYPKSVLFFEPRTGLLKPLKPATEYFRPGEWFDFTATAAGGNIVFTVNGQTVYTMPNTETKPIGFLLRPHRNKMEIKEFSVEGTPCGTHCFTYERLNDLRVITPIYRYALAVDADQELTIDKVGSLCAGKYRLKLCPVGAQEAISLEVAVNQAKDPKQLNLTIPAAQLKEIWEKSQTEYNARPIKMTLSDKNNIYEYRLLLYNSLKSTDFPQCSVERIGGTPSFVVNGSPLGTITSTLSTDFMTKKHRSQTIRDFAAAGVKGNLLWVEPGTFSENGKINEEAFLKNLYEALTRIICDNPDSVVDLHWKLFAPQEWSSIYPEEMIKLDNGIQSLQNAPGKKLQPSYASEVWRTETVKVLESLLVKLRKSPFADRIAIFRLCYANCGEWNNWGYHEQAFVDFSAPMQRAFGKWLQQKYGTDSALQSAWGNQEVKLDSGDLVPWRAARMAETRFVRGGNEAQPVIDYYQFFQLYTVETIEYFAKAVKKATDSKLLVGAYYGYYIGHYSSAPYHFQDSGNYALRRYLESPYLDFLGCPYPYETRRSDNDLNGLAASVALHGKVWESENDQRTHNCGPEERIYGATDSLAESIAIAKREFMMNLQRRASYYFFDFMKEWYRDPEFMATVATLKKIDNFVLKAGRENKAKVAYILSEETIPYLSNNPQNVFKELRSGILGFNNRIGTGIDYYSESDLDKIDFTPYQAVVFANAFYVSDRVMKLTKDRVCRNGRFVLFLYAPGVIGPEGKIDLERSRNFTGIGLQINPEGEVSRINSVGAAAYIISNPAFKYQTLINDDKATPIAVFPDGKIAGAVRKFPTHTAAVLCHPAPNSAWLRTWLRKYGVYIYQNGDAVFNYYYFAGPLIGIYSRSGGPGIIDLPRKVEVVADMFSGEIIAKDVDRFGYDMGKGINTRIFYAGPVSKYKEYLKMK